MTRVVVTLMESDAEASIDAARAVDADVFEVRFDAWTKVDDAGIASVRRAIERPLIATCRAQAEGGRWTRGEDERAAVLRKALVAGFEFLDVERASTTHVAFREWANKANVILSRHHLDKVPHPLRVEPAPGISKLACTVRSWEDTLRLMVAARDAVRRHVRHAAMGMGESSTRLLAPLLGSEFVYSAPRSGKEAAPGQVPVSELRSTWSFWGLEAKTPASLAFVIGSPIAHSLSPAMHNAGYRTCGIDAAYAALEPPDRREDFGRTLESLSSLDALGANVTIPFKGWAAGAVDGRDEIAERTGAVNTVVVRDGQLEGYNTDVEGIRASLTAAGTSLHGVEALVLGTGGAARAALDALAQDNAHVTVAARRPEAASERQGLADVRIVPWERRTEFAPTSELVVNCTPTGLHGKENPLAGVRWSASHTVLDLVYDPPVTPMLEAARAAGARVVSGLEVLLRQGAEAFRLMTKRVPPVEAMRRALEDRAGNWPVGPTPSSPSASMARLGGEGSR